MFLRDDQSNLAAQLPRSVNALSGGEKATFDQIMFTAPSHTSRSSSTLAISKALGLGKFRTSS